MPAVLRLPAPTSVPLDDGQLASARAVYASIGLGARHRARPDFGDCFAHALAKTRKLPLLFKGADFVHTDVEPAFRPA